MEEMRNRGKRDEIELVNVLASLPVKNIESKIQFLNSQLETRVNLSNELLDSINARVREFENSKWKLRYSDAQSTIHINSHLAEKERQKSLELVACFRDCLDLRHQLENSRAELRKAKAKLRLLKT